MKTISEQLLYVIRKLDNGLLLFLRLLFAYGFYKPARMKWNDINAIGSWFEGMGYPFPMINAYLAGVTELLGVVLLTLGLGTRLISIPLIIIMLVAILTVHMGNGFDASVNGFKIPLYYIGMLLTLIVFGGGKFSVDELLTKKNE